MKKITKLLLTLLMCICFVGVGNKVKAQEATAIEMVSGPVFNEKVSEFLEKESVEKIVFKQGDLPTDPNKYVILSATGNNIRGAMNGKTFEITVSTGNTIKFATDSHRMFEGEVDGVKNVFAYVQEIDFGKDVIDTSSMTNFSDMFHNCENLKTINLSEFKTSNVHSMHHMFNGCSSLEEITFGNNFDSSKVTNMDELFQGCSNLEEVDLNNLDTSSVIYMNGMFNKCDSLTYIDVSNFDTKNVTDMGRMFARCHYLTSVKFGANFDTSKVEDMSNMFAQDANLTSIDLSNFNLNSLKDASEMFKGCAFLSRIYTKDYLDFSKIENTYNMFLGCISLVGGEGTAVDIEHLDGSYGRIDGGEEKPGYFTPHDGYIRSQIYPGEDGKFYYDDENNKAIVVENITHKDGVVTMNGLNVDSKYHNEEIYGAVTLVLPDNTKEIIVKGTNIITNLAEENRNPIMMMIDNVAFTGDGSLTISNVTGPTALAAESKVIINGPTLNIISNPLVDIDGAGSLYVNKLVMNAGALNVAGAIGIYLFDAGTKDLNANSVPPGLEITGGEINTYGTYAGLIERVNDNKKVDIVANAIGRTLLIEDLQEASLQEITDTNRKKYGYFVGEDKEKELARFVNLTRTGDPTPIDPQPKTDEMQYIKGYGFAAEMKKGEQTSFTAHIDASYLTEKVIVKDINGNELTAGEDYVTSRGSIKVTFTPEFLSKLSAGKHTYTITLSNGVRNDVVFDVHVNVKDTSTPSPTKDESCEKVIGPTWHWNNKKGICEDTGVVKTYTR